MVLDIERAYNALVKTAEQAGVPVSQVIQNIDDAIKEAYEDARCTNDPVALALWERIPRVGTVPAAVEFVAFLGGMLSDEAEQIDVTGNVDS